MARGWLIGGGVFLGILLVASIIIAAMEREEPLAQGTPEAAVQDYLRATQNDQYEVAYGFLSEGLQSDCTLTQFVGQPSFPGDDRLSDARITLDEVNIVDDTAFVNVQITQFYSGGPFGTSESTFAQTFSLRQFNGQWKFVEQPWPFYNCPFRVPEPPIPFPVVPLTPTPSPEPEIEPTATPTAP
jgi:hypothetical protein